MEADCGVCHDDDDAELLVGLVGAEAGGLSLGPGMLLRFPEGTLLLGDASRRCEGTNLSLKAGLRVPGVLTAGELALIVEASDETGVGREGDCS